MPTIRIRRFSRAAAFVLPALALLALAACNRRPAPRAGDAAPAPAASPAPAPVRTAPPSPPELQALERVAGQLDTMCTRAAAESARLTPASDSVLTAAADPAAVAERWSLWGDPWVASLGEMDRLLPPEPVGASSTSLRYAHRQIRLVIYELRLIPSTDPDHPVPTRADAERHIANAQRALAEARRLMTQALAEVAGA